MEREYEELVRVDRVAFAHARARSLRWRVDVKGDVRLNRLPRFDLSWLSCHLEAVGWERSDGMVLLRCMRDKPCVSTRTLLCLRFA